MIPNETVREVLEVARIEEVVADYVNLKRSGSNLTGLCPFHDEKTPSFSVSPAKNIFKCFGCGRAGDSVAFLREHEQYSFVEAIKSLAEKYGITIEEREMTQQEVQQMDKAESLYGILHFASNYYQRALKESKEGKAIGLSYFHERGLLDRTIETFQLGYAGKDEQLSAQLKKMGYEDELLAEAGLINKRGGDFFQGRVVFPIHNLSGKPIALAGRILGQGFGPKYLNSPESAIYVKNKVLYGMHLAKNHIRKSDKCYLTEGYTDVISLHQNGIKNVVASSGTSLTTNQVALMKRFSSSVTILYDGDAAGIKAALRSVELMLQADLNVYVVLFPEGSDPDSYIREVGHDAFVRFLEENEKDFILFQADLELSKAKNDPIKRAAFVTSIIKTIAHIQDAVKRSAYIQELSIQSGMSEDIIVTELNKVIKKRMWSERKQRPKVTPTVNEENRGDPTKPKEKVDNFPRERNILRVLLNGGHKQIPKLADITVRDYVLEQLREVPEFLHPTYNAIYQMIKEQEDDNWSIDHLKHHEDESIRTIVIELLTEGVEISDNWEDRWDIHLQTQPKPEENYYEDSLKAILQLKLDRIQRLSEENNDILKDLEDDDKLNEHLLIQNKLNEMKKELAYELRTIVLK